MHFITLDTEQHAILVDAAETAIRLLNYRVERADPEGLISKSIALQARKIDQVKHQLALDPMPTRSAMTKAQAKHLDQAMKRYLSETDTTLRDTLFEAVVTEVMAARGSTIVHKARKQAQKRKHTQPGAPKAEGARAGPASSMRKLPKAASNRNPPPLASGDGRASS